jgi:hypothetical protein
MIDFFSGHPAMPPNPEWKDQIKAEHKCTHGWPGSVPMGISNSKCHTWIYVGFSHWVTRSRESKTRGFSSTCGSTGTWKYLVLRILNINQLVNCKYKYMWNKIILRHCVTPWQNQIWLNWSHPSYHQSTLSSYSHSHPTSKTNPMFLSRLIMHITKVSFLILMCVLTVYLMQTNEPEQVRTCTNEGQASMTR